MRRPLVVLVPAMFLACMEPRHAATPAAPATSTSSAPIAIAKAASPPPSSSASTPTDVALTPTPPRPFTIRRAVAAEDLPAPTKVAKAKKKSGCGAVHIGAVTIPLVCRASGYMKLARASVRLLEPRMLATKEGFVGDAEPPTLVDHRLDGTEGPIRNQKEVGACTAFSLASSIDHAYAHATGRPGYVSVMHIWSRYADGFKEDAAANNLGHPLTAESLWTYDAAAACKWIAPQDCGSYCQVQGASCGAPDEARRAKADALPELTLATITKVDPSTSSFVSVLAKGQDIWFGMNIDPDVFENVSGPNVVVPDFDASDSDAGHAMSIAGYRVQANGTYFLLKNSWGKSWGDQGYAWIHESTLFRNLADAYAYVVDVTPSKTSPRPSNPTPTAPTTQPTSAPASAPTDALPWPFDLPGLPFPQIPTPKPMGCRSGQVPDTSTGACGAPCADGSAPTDGACATQNACPKGYVDFFGFCVIAGPSKSGLVPGSGVKYQCAPGGCLYVMPKGVEGCTAAMCTLACPAPKFAAARGPNGLHCTE